MRRTHHHNNACLRFSCSSHATDYLSDQNIYEWCPSVSSGYRSTSGMGVVSKVQRMTEVRLQLTHTLRPSTREACVPPCAMQQHRMSHQMLGPCCLCPMLDVNLPDFVEAAIYEVPAGERYAGQWVASCARDRCGYFGKPPEFRKRIKGAYQLTLSVAMERYYDQNGIRIRCYTRRGGFFH